MARTTQKKPDELEHHWYFAEWLADRSLKQADVIKALDWSKGKTSPLFNDEQIYNQQHVDEVATYLGIEPWALLMPPDLARYVMQTFKHAGIASPRKAAGSSSGKPIKANKKAAYRQG